MFEKLIFGTVLASIATIALAVEQSDLQSCAEIEEKEQRLECFEALAAGKGSTLPDEFAEPKLVKTPESSVTLDEAHVLIGAEQIENADDPESSSTAIETEPLKTAKEYAREGLWFSVTRFEQDAERRKVFYMRDGQVWREIEPSRIFFPEDQAFEVLINQGRMGDYRLRLEGEGRRTRVVRLI